MKSPGNRPKPLYQRVADDIVARIDSGIWQTGQKLPSERELCERYEVSQITVRRALRELAHLGRVYSHHGLGWFVSAESAPGSSTQEATLILPDLNWATARLVRCLVEEFGPAGVELRLAFTDGVPQREEEALRGALAHGANAVLLAVGGEARQLKSHYDRLLAEISVPTILLWHEVAGVTAPAAIVDEGLCMQKMTRHILDLGHRRVAYSGGDPSLVEGQRRYWGFATTLWEHDLELPLDWVFAGDSANEDQGARFRRVFHPSDRPTALVCASDRRAAEAMGLLYRLGLKCPQDVAIVGLGDRDFAPLLPAPLTTFRFDLQRLGEAIAAMTLDLLAGRSVKNVRVSGEITARQSCGIGYPRAL